LVILDEIGRGTATYDGLSIAWATLEHLQGVNRCRALFATHYHELTEIADSRPGVVNRTVAVAENADDVVFLHRIVAGAATKSYGIHVARIAGVPPAVISRARAVLAALERHGAQAPAAASTAGLLAAASSAPVSAPTQLTLFGYVAHPVVERLQGLDLDSVTPRQAVALLNELQEAARRA
jgi:DNA mismatch repair protein MutS